MANSNEHELAIRIAGRVENSLKQSFGFTEDGLNRLVGAAKKAATLAATTFASIKVGEFIGDTVNAAMDFESAMADVAKVVDGLKDDNGELTQSYHDMSDSIIEMSKNIPMTAEELATIMAYAGQAGVASEDLIRFTETAAKMGVAFDSTAEEAGDWMAIWRTALQMTQDDVEVLGDQINYLGNTSSENALKLSQIVTDIGSLAKISGVSAADLAALGAATTGINADVASTGLKNMFIAMGQGASATKKQQAVLEKLGFTAIDVAQRMQIDSKGMILDLLSAINMLPKAEQEAAISAYFGKESIATVAVLASNVSNLEEQFDKVADSTKYAGSMEKEYATRAATSANNVQLLQNKFKALQIQIGTYLLPCVNVGLDILSGAIDILTGATENGDRAFMVLTEAAKSAGLGIKTFIQLVSNGTNVFDAFSAVMSDNFGVELPSSVNSAIGVVKNFLSQGKEVVDFLTGMASNSIQNIKEKIAENEATFQSIIDLTSDIKDRLFEAFDYAKPTIIFISEEALPAIVDVLLKVTGGVADVADAFVKWDGFLPTITAIGGAVGAIKFYKMAKDIYGVVKAMGALNFAKIKDKAETIYINGLYAKLTSPIGLVVLAIAAVIAIGVLLYKNWDLVKEKAAQLGAWLGEKFNGIKEVIGNAVDGFKDKFPVAFAFIEGVFNGFKVTVNGVIGGIKIIFGGVIDFVQGVFTGNWKQALDGLKNIFMGVFKGLTSVALAPLNALKGVVTGTFNAIDTATGGKLSEIKAKALEAWNNVKETAGTVLEAAKSTISEKLANIKAAYDEHGGGITGATAAYVEGVKEYWSLGYSFINNLTSGKLDEIKGVMSTKLSEAQATASAALEGIKGKFQSTMDGAKNIVSGAIDKIKGFFNFNWELPKLKLPHFKINGEFNLGPPPKIPTFGVDWYKDGGIMTDPTVFGVNGNNAMVGGEAGAEAILPLEALWNKMGAFINNAINNPNDVIGSAIRMLNERLDDFVVGANRKQLAVLSEDIGTSICPVPGQNAPEGLGGMTITYAPVYRFEGSAPSKTEIVQAEKMSQAEFDKMMRQWQKDRDRVKF